MENLILKMECKCATGNIKQTQKRADPVKRVIVLYVTVKPLLMT